MLQINLPNTDIIKVERLIPDGYSLEKKSDTLYNVTADRGCHLVAVCDLKGDLIQIRFFADSEPDMLFVNKFGELNPKLNPMGECFGFVFENDNGEYVLEDMPLADRAKKMRKITQYVAQEKAYFVTYYRGQRTDTSLYVLTMRKIMLDTQLDRNIGPKRLKLSEPVKSSRE